MMHKSPVIRMVGMAAWFVTAIGSLIMGLSVLGFDTYVALANAGFGPILMFLDVLFLVAGCVSLGMFGMALMHCSRCKEGHCTCN